MILSTKSNVQRGISPHHQAILGYQLGIPQFFNSHTIYLEIASDLTGQVKDSVLGDHPAPNFRCQSQTQLITCASD